MSQPQAGSFTLMRVAGITVYVHWSWFLMAWIEFQIQRNNYSTPVWILIEYVTLFGIVLLHEFGHALACRQVGGSAEQIILWPLGGIAYVAPPPRPGAWLWSIAAGPLVNVVLVPITILLCVVSATLGWAESFPDLDRYLESVALINFMLLVFNMLPIYPLDGGQILQSLLWFVVGRPASLKISSVIGLIGGVGLVLLALLVLQSVWMVVMAAFLMMRAAAGFSQARMLEQIAALPRHPGLACPSCGEAPIQGDFWRCAQCQHSFDMIAQQGRCPQCGAGYENVPCPQCGQSQPAAAWQRLAPAAEGGHYAAGS